MIDTAKGYLQKTSEFFDKYAPFISARYKNNSSAFKELGLVLLGLFLLLCLLILPSETETVSVKVDPDSKVTTTTATTSHSVLDVFALYLKIVGGSAVLFGAYFAWKRLEVNQEGQITERFTRAIDQLGAESLEIRIGGIYALERIAKDSERDYWPILEILTAYIRENSKARLPESPEQQYEFEDDELVPKSIGTDIEAILSVIKNRARKAASEPLNFQGSYLCFGQLNFAKLESTDFSNADLRHANFLQCSLEGTNFRGSYFNTTNFHNSALCRANMQYIHGRDIDFSGAFMPAVKLNCSKIRHSSFYEANLCEAVFDETRLIDCRFIEANLAGARFIDADIRSSNFEGAKFSNTMLLGVKFTKVIGLTKEQIENAIIDGSTTLPDEFMEVTEWYQEQIKRSDKWLNENYGDNE